MTTSSTPLVPIGRSDVRVFPLALGGNVFGWTADRDTSFAILDAFTDGGGNLVDTADGYSHWVPGHTGGESETLIGEWIARTGRRDDLVIATKVSTNPQFAGLAPENVRAAADASLARLGTDVIDVYYAHFDDDSVPLEDTVAAFSGLVDAGKIRTIAVSNYTAERIDEWMAITEANGFHAPVALQPHYNLVEREFEGALRERAERFDLGVFPYFALAKGFLTGKYRGGAVVDSPRAGGAAEYLNARGDAVIEALDVVAEAHGASLATVALAWLREQPTVVAPIASASRLEQLPDLLASATLELTPAELASLSAASAS
ncbi:aryl-alcohol dehydrogenase-like predicted oxidoreductase [Labedella gwakjiensis]|uniref:Aldo/keto reductase n=1 Tax=Labedella gwakjiensis TaxID=390269 RepID=A0A2P8GW50_9MICO|nr:aldo/keto reductase [Labedella gwakjiensis]PSL38186.1 aryl-alcohol dehydrogenase-like predicted oxidoreductase [Labedella gwakjiensis]RUQ87271.1 aldo/keto reductase [Labedella gwakjiensis]